MEELTGNWYLKKRFFGGYDVYVEVEGKFFPYSKSYRKMRGRYELYRLNGNYKNK